MRTLNEAALGLGLKHPVRIEKQQRSGSTYLGLWGGKHHIALGTGRLDRFCSAQYIWHELQHAVQVERDGDNNLFKEQMTAAFREAGLWTHAHLMTFSDVYELGLRDSSGEPMRVFMPSDVQRRQLVKKTYRSIPLEAEAITAEKDEQLLWEFETEEEPCQRLTNS